MLVNEFKVKIPINTARACNFIDGTPVITLQLKLTETECLLHYEAGCLH
ncbi:hypothetical protein T11_10346 [Trichinella zimbabwensis]|uniref:Uncharacterized protein n=1 Tax=Trichinella zimbabwensis TaxID=268475 RepID=A0A0V1GDW2_9BILA|nr:hypothetical protein T11_10346 [Trichinella zimbabwensis]